VTDAWLPYGKQQIDDDDVAAVVDVLRSDWLTTGPVVSAFESALARVGQAPFAAVVSSGTAALHAAYHAAGLAAGDEIVTSTLTFVATASAALMQGARVRFADVEPTTGLIDPASAAAAIGERTRLLVAVDYAGHPADYVALGQLAAKRGLTLVADAAHSLGATRDGRPVGSLAEITTLSFHPVKVVTTGEGGAVLTLRAAVDEGVRRFRNHGILRERPGGAETRPEWYYEIQALGMNYRLPDILCALGMSQLEKLQRFLARRRALAARYRAGLADVSAIELPVERPGVASSWHLYVIRVAEAARRDAFFGALRAAGIGAQVHYIPVHRHPLFVALGHRAGEFPVAEDFAARAVSVPLYPKMTDVDADRVIATIRQAAAAVL
jgi:UDP-4-amino-4,6-dideoxy-N-acetyl-beta-L-altrosamine transaminase